MAKPLRVHLEEPISAARAFARAAALRAQLGSDVPAVLYAAPLTGKALALGAYQHAAHALLPMAWREGAVLRRSTGGVTVQAGDGIAYVALGLSDPSALVPCAPGKLLNRHVRGLLAGLRALGVQANYFGRDFVSAGAEPCAYLGWSEDEAGRVCVEAFIALGQDFAVPRELCGYPAPSEPRFRGKPLVTLAAVTGKSLDARAVLEAVADGYLRTYNAERESWAASAPLDEPLASADEHAAALAVDPDTNGAGLIWSAPHEEVIGFVSAGVALDSKGAIEALRLGGDFFQQSRVARALETALIGQRADEPVIGAAIDRVFRAPGAIEGIRSLRSLQAALLDACARAHAARDETP